jgi:hypothetical protein
MNVGRLTAGGQDGIVVLVENSMDFAKNEKIKAHLKTSTAKFSVAIKEDIEDFIYRVFKESKI